MKKRLFKLIVVCSAFLGALAGCDKGGGKGEDTPKEPEIGDKNWIDYAHNGSVSLNLDYKGKDFYQDGIGEVTLKCSIDGDTAHFYPVVKKTTSAPIKSRYYGIDTPESTGRVQEYGQEASDFNKEKLKNAAANGTIVVSSPQLDYGRPSPDSTGERYVSLIWINETKKNASYTELTLLNLEIVQYGYSWAKNVADMPSLADTFYAAEKQAKTYKLNLFSGKPAGKFNYGDYKDCSILDLKVATEHYIKDKDYVSEWDNEKVRIKGTVAGFNDGTMYIQSYFTEEASELVRGEGNGIKGGEYASINVFCGMADVPAKYKKVNTYLQLCVIAKYSENFGFQLTGAEGHFKTVDSTIKDDDAQILLKAEDNEDDQKLHVAEYTAAELSRIASEGSFECLNCAVKTTTPVKVSSATISANGTEATLSFENVAFEAYINFNYKPYPDDEDPDKKWIIWKTSEDFLGKQFMLDGIYTYHQVASGKVYYQFVFNDTYGLKLVA